MTVAEIAFSPTVEWRRKKREMDAMRDNLTWSNLRFKRENRLSYSRHLCVTTRSANIREKTPATSSSDSVFTSPLTHAGYEPYDYFRRRNLTLQRQVSVQGHVPREVYKKERTFHRKFGTMPVMLQTHTSPPTPDPTRTKTNPANSNSVCFGMDDDASSFCESVSSIACSSITHVDKQEKWTKDARALSDKITKFDAIEKWLQGLPKPVFKTG